MALRAKGQGSNKQTEIQPGEPKSGPHPKISHSKSLISLPMGYVGHTYYPKVPGAQEMISSITTQQVTTGETEAQRRIRGPFGFIPSGCADFSPCCTLVKE